MSKAEGPFFTVERNGPVAEITMNRPDTANAMSPDFWEDLPRIIDDLTAQGSVRAAILCGAGRHFSGGMDLSTFNSIASMLKAEPGRAAHTLRRLILKLQHTFTALEQAPFPVIAAIHGACIGGAIDMITACDIRLASQDAFFAIEEINIGMAADVGTLQRLPKLIAPGIAAELALTGRRFDSAEARSIGLVTGTFPDRDVMIAEARLLADALAARSPLAIAGIKRNLAFSRDHSVADGLDYIATWNGGMLRAEDLMEAIQARAQKRAAVFKDLGAPA
ncbi:crotonase/enoyl-CoA hydratase family protein [Zhengella sp. ZM62]|uniref:crotonase/enoyl-CoA hydratase family protein n=1 Tax=Zhengella sedimenti TaxID=3390035 RepID=UPI003976C8D4